jgi:hypothetical protein
MTTANTSSRLETSSAELSTISTASGSGGSATESSTAAPDSEDLGRRRYVGEEDEEKESLGEERERKPRLVLLEKESVGDKHCFGQILQWAARDEQKERVIDAIVRTLLACSLSLSLSLSELTALPFWSLPLFYTMPGLETRPILSVSFSMTNMPFNFILFFNRKKKKDSTTTQQ